MKKAKLFAAVAAAHMLLGTVDSKASTITDYFAFYDASNAVLATGSFSYDAGAVGQLGYAGLNTFSINVLGANYDLAFTQGSGANDYNYFAYDTVSNTFVTGSVNGWLGTSSTILAATQGSGALETTGFFFDPLPQAGCASDVCDGALQSYVSGFGKPGGPIEFALNYTISSSPISPVPEISTWAMMLLGFLGLIFVTQRRRVELGVARLSLRRSYRRSDPDTGRYLTARIQRWREQPAASHRHEASLHHGALHPIDPLPPA